MARTKTREGHVVLTWRAFKEILENGDQAGKILARIGDKAAHITIIEVFKVISEFEEEGLRWLVPDELEDLNALYDGSLTIHGLDVGFFYRLYGFAAEDGYKPPVGPGMEAAIECMPFALADRVETELNSSGRPVGGKIEFIDTETVGKNGKRTAKEGVVR